MVAALDRKPLADLAALAELLVQRSGEAVLEILEGDAVLRTLGPSERGLDLRQLELEDVGEDRVRRGLGAEQTLRLGIGRHQGDAIRGAAGVAQILQRVVIDREEAAGRAIFGR